MSVLDKTIQKCRSALAARIPIIYILSDSLELVQKIANDDRLVARVFDSGIELRINGRQFLRNYPNLKVKPTNIIAGAPMGGTTAKYLSWQYPTLCYCKAENVKQEDLEQYIAYHENEAASNYDVLQNSVVILYSSQIFISPMVQMYTEFVTVDYPNAEEIYSQIKTESQRFRLKETETEEVSATALDESCRKYSTELVGFTEEEVRMTLHQILTRQMDDPWEHPLSNEESVIRLIRNRKESKMHGSILELKDASDATIGGMDQLTHWTHEQADRLKQADLMRRERGISPPKGVLLCGIPGCGKSEAAKATAKTFNLPLIQMDMGRLMGKYVGESEQNMRNALAMAEAMAPCVLWIDELEKGFSAAGSGEDSGPFKRMFATLLGWMQDKKAPVFIFATANDIGGLPKEFFRSGRFDEKFAVFLPTAQECVQILQKHMMRIQETVEKASQKNGRNLLVFQKDAMNPEHLRSFVDEVFQKDGQARIAIGSDILQIVNTALAIPYIRKKYPLSPEVWREALEGAAQNCSFYGDSEENLDSIAISYCRLLRKGMRPTTSNPLIKAEDYQPPKMNELLDKSEASKKKTISDATAKSKEMNLDGYDLRVYQTLRERINILAPYVEQLEAEAMLRR